MTRNVILAALVVLSASACGRAPHSGQNPKAVTHTSPRKASHVAPLEQRVAGSWIVSADSSDYTSVPKREVFSKDGKFKLYVYSNASCSKIVQHAGGTWAIKNGVLVTMTTSTSLPKALPVGTVTKDKILSVSRTQMVLHSLDNGGIHRRTRSDKCLAKKAPPTQARSTGTGGAAP